LERTIAKADAASSDLFSLLEKSNGEIPLVQSLAMSEVYLFKSSLFCQSCIDETRREEIAEGTMAFHFAKPADFQFRAGQSMDPTLLNPPESDSDSLAK